MEINMVKTEVIENLKANIPSTDYGELKTTRRMWNISNGWEALS
jgi:hypothetical protein